jgi:hypothetical protein
MVEKARLFLDSALQTLEPAYPLFTKLRRKLARAMENAKTVDALVLIDAVHRVTAIVGDDVRARFQALVTTLSPADNLDIWLVKAAAAVHFNGGDFQTGLRYIERLPRLFRSNFGAQKLALAFTSLASVITKFPPDSVLPLLFMWAALLALSHPSQRLRGAATALLTVILPFGLARLDMAAIEATRCTSDVVANAVARFENEFRVNFAANFAYAFNIALTRVFEEVETRRAGVALLKAFIPKLREGDANLAVYFALPFVAFGQEDAQWIANGSISEFIFRDFGARKKDDAADIVTYLAMMLGERHCAHRIEVIADCLIYGAKQCPEVVRMVKRMALEKCWKMLASENNQGKIDKIAEMCAAFCVIPWPKELLVPAKADRPPEDVVNAYIAGTIDGIAAYVRAGK